MAREEEQNAEANEFAMRLLVPDLLLAKEDLSGIDFTDDGALKELARKYQVSVGVMVIRLREFSKERRCKI